ECRPRKRRHFDESKSAFFLSNRADPPWSSIPRYLCLQPICQKSFSRTCRLKGRALSPIACKNYPARTHPLGNKDAENFHEVRYSGKICQWQIRGIWSWQLGSPNRNSFNENDST